MEPGPRCLGTAGSGEAGQAVYKRMDVTPITGPSMSVPKVIKCFCCKGTRFRDTDESPGGSASDSALGGLGLLMCHRC